MPDNAPAQKYLSMINTKNCSRSRATPSDPCEAMLKLAPTPAEWPAQGTFVSLNIDGVNLPSDRSLRLAGAATRMLRGDMPLTAVRPNNP